MAPGDDRFAEELVDVDTGGLVQIEPGRVVAGRRVWIDKPDGLALEVVNVFVGAVGLDVDDRIIADRTVIVAGSDKGLGLDPGQKRRRIRRRGGRSASLLAVTSRDP